MTDEKFDSEMNFSKVLFLHLNRTAQSVEKTDLFMANIDVFEIFLSPYLDGSYNEDIQKTTTKSMAMSALDSLTPGKKDATRTQMINNAMHKFRCLMKFAESKGLLLEKTSSDEEWNLKEEDNEPTTTDAAETADVDKKMEI